jgi:NAD(P)-dependent dehydrogenase (short-subunit alcohol dehydrogenase family)
VARETYGGIDLWVNTAGMGGAFATLREIDLGPESSWRRALAVNFTTPWAGLVRAAADMRRRGKGGSIINLSSFYADQPVALRGEYTISKMLLHACAALVAEPLRPHGIAVTDLQPSLTEASDLERVRRSFLREFERLGVVDPASDRGVRSWLRYTIPSQPPRSRDVAEAVLFAARNGMQQSGSSIRVSTLPTGSGRSGARPHAPPRALRGRPLAGRTALVVTTGRAGADLDRTAAMAAALLRGGAERVVVAASDIALERLPRHALPAQVEISACNPADPAELAALFGAFPAPDAVVHIASRPRPAERFLDFPGSKTLSRLGSDELEAALASHLESVERFLEQHLTSALGVSRESLRRLPPDGALLLVGASSGEPEAALLNRALEQLARVARVEWLLLGSGARASVLEAAGLSAPRLAERALQTLAVPARRAPSRIPAARPPRAAVAPQRRWSRPATTAG